MKIIFKTSNSTKFAVHLGAGYCFGMSCDWAKTSLASTRGRGVMHKGELNEFKWAIGQTAYETKNSADESLIKGMGLSVTSHYKGSITSFSAVCRHMCETTSEGTYIFCIDGDGGGHAMGFRRTKTTDVLGKASTSIQWLDPNLGLHEFSDKDDFILNAALKLDALYGTGEPDIHERLMENFELFEVESA